MTDPYSPSTLEKKKGEIAKKAIQRWLYEEFHWYGTPEGGFRGGGWMEMLPPITGGPTGTMQLRYNMAEQMNTDPGQPPPGSTYKGEDFSGGMGQQYYLYEVDPWTDIYEPWYEKINSAFQGWEQLPDPAEYADPIASMRNAVTRLTPMPDKSGGPLSTDFASVDLASNLSLLDHWVNAGTDGASQGMLVFAFDQAYGAARIQAVMQNQAQAGIVLGMTLLGEQRIWEKTRKDIMRLAEEAEKAFDVAQGGGGSINFEVVQAFIGLVGDFVPPGVAGVLTKASDALSLVEKLKPQEHKDDPKPEITGDSAESIYTSMTTAINKLDMTVLDQELELVTHTLQGLLDEMREHAGTQFHIHPTNGVATDLVHAKAIDVHPEYLKHIGYQTVPNIAAVMAVSADEAATTDKPLMWDRGGYIGYVPAGPRDRYKDVLGQFDAVTTGSAKELVEAGELLAHGAGFLQDTDGYQQQALKNVQDEIHRGKDGWDNSHVGVPDPPPVVRGPNGKPMIY
jgi:hypothetical protein